MCGSLITFLIELGKLFFGKVSIYPLTFTQQLNESFNFNPLHIGSMIVSPNILS